MPIASAADLVTALRQFHLLEAAQLDEVDRMVHGRALDPRALAQQMIERGWLTPYQVNQLGQGRGQDLVLGSYVVLERLGEGGMGAVFKARHRRLDRIDALKVIRKEQVANAQAVQRFHQEARAAARLTHPNIVAVHDASESNGTHFLAMEYIEGTDLAKLVKTQGPLPVELACDAIRQAALGLQHAHEQEMVHRDIKPANLLLNPKSGMVKVLDLGLARLQQRSADGIVAAGLTQSGAVMGTPDYMSPEQALNSHQVDIRADVYSLGCTLYYLLTGQPPFPGGEMTEKLLKHQLQEPVPVEQLRPDVPSAVAAIVRKLMAKKPEDRYQTPAAVAEVLANTDRELAPDATLSTHERWARAVNPANTIAYAGSRQPRARRRFLLGVGAGGAVLLLALAVLAYLFWRDVQSPSPTPTPNETPAATVTLRVEANQPWQDSGVDVPAGQTVTLLPEGHWRKGRILISAAGQDQAPGDRAVLLQAPLLCLLARIGEETPAVVLTKQVLKAHHGGRLVLQVNDLDLINNSGGLKVVIAGGVRSGAAAAPAVLLPSQRAEQELGPLLARAADPLVKPEQRRDEVVDFCLRYAGLPQAFRAGQKLPGLPPLVNSIGMKLAPIPPGKFRMGSPENEPGRTEAEGPQHEVEITRPFFMGVNEVTVGQFKAFVKETGYKTEAETSGGAWGPGPDGKWANDPKKNWQNPGIDQTDEHPVVSVSWNDAQAFCKWLSKKEGVKYALPTEAQWEYCCRAGSPSKFGFGNDDTELPQYAWYRVNSGRKPHPTGEKKPNAWGLYDMLGNAWEWCQDLYDKDYYEKSPKQDPEGPSAGAARVMRGGAFSMSLTGCRAANRLSRTPFPRHADDGFRVVLLRSAFGEVRP